MAEIAFVAPRTPLDTRTGASVSLRSVLEALASAGHRCRAITCTLFQGHEEYPLASVAGVEAAKSAYVGRRIRVHREGVVHELYRTRSTIEANLRQDEADAYGRFVDQLLHETPPDLVLTYGSDGVALELHRQLRRLTPRLIFYLATAHHDDRTHLSVFDHVVVPSGFMRDYYARRLGVDAEVLPSIVGEASFAAPPQTLAASVPQARRHGVVTLINPCPEKGGTLFLRLLELAAREAPDFTFLAVEVRYTADQWQTALGVSVATQPNLWWLPNQRDLRRVYARTNALLVPSFWEEATARVIAEAQLGGIPVLASRHAGIPEQLNGGGFQFDIPRRCRANYGAVPTETEVRPWLDTLRWLIDDEAAYRDASARALAAAEPWRPERARQRVTELFARLLGDSALGGWPSAE